MDVIKIGKEYKMAKKSNANIGFEKEVVYAIYIENYLIPD